MFSYFGREERNGHANVEFHISSNSINHFHSPSEIENVWRKFAETLAGECQNWKSPRKTGEHDRASKFGKDKSGAESFFLTLAFYSFRSQDDIWAGNGLLFRTISPKLSTARFPSLPRKWEWKTNILIAKYLFKTCFIGHQWATSSFCLVAATEIAGEERKKKEAS